MGFDVALVPKGLEPLLCQIFEVHGTDCGELSTKQMILEILSKFMEDKNKRSFLQ